MKQLAPPVFTVQLQVVFAVLLTVLAAPVAGAHKPHSRDPQHLRVAPRFSKGRQSLMYILNNPLHRHTDSGGAGGGALSSLGQALVFKPDLGACQSFANGCHEGAIVTLPHNNVMQTMGAGLGMRVGGVRFEYAYGIHTGANFIGIRSHIP